MYITKKIPQKKEHNYDRTGQIMHTFLTRPKTENDYIEHNATISYIVDEYAFICLQTPRNEVSYIIDIPIPKNDLDAEEILEKTTTQHQINILENKPTINHTQIEPKQINRLPTVLINFQTQKIYSLQPKLNNYLKKYENNKIKFTKTEAVQRTLQEILNASDRTKIGQIINALKQHIKNKEKLKNIEEFTKEIIQKPNPTTYETLVINEVNRQNIQTTIKKEDLENFLKIHYPTFKTNGIYPKEERTPELKKEKVPEQLELPE